MIDADRAIRAFSDVLAVEHDDSGFARIVTLSDCYAAVPDEGMHLCPDREYHDTEMCKHLIALEAVRGRLDIPTGWLTVENLDERTDPEFDIDVPDRIGRNRQLTAFETDGGECEDCADLPGDWPCADCATSGAADLSEVDA